MSKLDRYQQCQYINKNGDLTNTWIVKSKKKRGPHQGEIVDRAVNEPDVYYLRTQVIEPYKKGTAHYQFSTLENALAYQKQLIVNSVNKRYNRNIISKERARRGY